MGSEIASEWQLAFQKRSIVEFLSVAGAFGLLSPVLAAIVPAMPALAVYLSPGIHGEFLAQLVVAAPAVSIICGAPLAGVLVRYIGLRASLIWLLLVYSSAGSFGFFATSFFPLLMSRLLVGLSGGGIAALSLAVITGSYSGDARETALGYMTAVANTIGLFGFFAGGWLVVWVGWRGPFLFYLLGVPVLIGILRVRKALVTSSATPRGSIRPLLPLWRFYCLIMLLSVGEFMVVTEGPFLFTQAGVTNAATQGTLFAFITVNAVIAPLFYGKLRKFLSVDKVLSICALFLGIEFLLLAFIRQLARISGIEPVILIASCCMLDGIGVGLIMPSISSVVMSATPEPLRGYAGGLIMACLWLGMFLTPLMMYPVRAALGLDHAILAAGVVFTLIALFMASTRVFRVVGSTI